MTTTWGGPAELLLRDADTGWSGIWALTHTAAMGALNLAMTVPLGVGVSVSYAAMDFREAQDELEWARPDVRTDAAPVRLGTVRPEDANEARAILDRLVAAALDRAAALAELETDLLSQAALSRVMARLITGRAKVTGRWS
ncbi:hypothetical protein [Cellulomonas sp. ATA003]|uniref:hypothetical protein n=1 Tax=Cellulomonas sp. ATA003 TaxID=3073064 RepID=UPI002872DBE7|nr:hypothetical protein [Cellulomonas sp. ATA003]WNB86144.1 hypothetical protein REH70_02375 [Cellulomonas sp. ATA003]